MPAVSCAAALLAGCALLNACASTPSPGARVDSGAAVSPSKRLVDLSAMEQQELCDSLAQTFGGYDRRVTCTFDGGQVSISAPANQATCAEQLSAIARFAPSCQTSVGEVVACDESLIIGVNACHDSGPRPVTDCGWLSDPRCQIPGQGSSSGTAGVPNDAGAG